MSRYLDLWDFLLRPLGRVAWRNPNYLWGVQIEPPLRRWPFETRFCAWDLFAVGACVAVGASWYLVPVMLAWLAVAVATMRWPR